jgi:hypothetical protein
LSLECHAARGAGVSEGATMEEEGLRPATKSRARRVWAAQQRRARV